MKILLYIFFSPFFLFYWFVKLMINIFRAIKIKQLDGRSFRIYVAGTQYENDNKTDRQSIILKCSIGEELFLVRTPSKYDESGIQIYRKNGECLGWVPTSFSYEFTSEIERDIIIRAFFHSIIKPNKNYGHYGAKVTIVKLK